MDKDKFKTAVKFKRFKDGDIIALFLEIEENDNSIMSYMHTGQHGGASKDLKYLRNATPREYQDLKNELESIGYNLFIR